MNRLRNYFRLSGRVLVMTAVFHSACAADLTNTLYVSIQAAVDAAQSNDTVHIMPGDYREQVVIINKALTLIGYPGTVLHAFSGMRPALGDYNIPQYQVLGAFRSAVVLSGLTLEGERRGGEYTQALVGVHLQSSDARITNCAFKGFRSDPLRERTLCFGVAVRNLVSSGFKTAEI